MSVLPRIKLIVQIYTELLFMNNHKQEPLKNLKDLKLDPGHGAPIIK